MTRYEIVDGHLDTFYVINPEFRQHGATQDTWLCYRTKTGEFCTSIGAGYTTPEDAWKKYVQELRSAVVANREAIESLEIKNLTLYDKIKVINETKLGIKPVEVPVSTRNGW